MGVAEHDLGAHRHQAVDEEHPRLEQLLVDQHRAAALGRANHRDRGEIGGKTRPRGVLDLRDRALEIGPHAEFLATRNEQVAAIPGHLEVDAQTAEGEPGSPVLLRPGVRDAQLAAGDRGQRDERPHLDVVGADLELGPAESLHALDHEQVRTDAVDRSPHRSEQPAKILDVRLARRVQDPRLALRQTGRHHRVLRPGDGGFVQEDLGPPQALPRTLDATLKPAARA